VRKRERARGQLSAGFLDPSVADLARDNAVPVTTAQRWVKEARRRGMLAPGRPGKAG
jgi:transposase-like protein